MFAPVPLLSLQEFLKTKQANDEEEGAKIMVNIRDTERQIEYWRNCKKKLKGSWHIIVSDNKTPNAFVTEVCPRRIFVNSGIFDLIATDDELAMVLSHEVSHLLCGHTQSK